MSTYVDLRRNNILHLFVEESINKIYSDFQAQLEKIPDLCKLSDLRFNNGYVPDYNNPELQQFYLLRYLPAYVGEYYEIYKAVLATNHLIEKKIKILSIGCGANLDYYGLYCLLYREGLEDNYNVHYIGYDIVNWQYRNLIRTNHNLEFIQKDITLIDHFEVSDFDIIIFPKSISEFGVWFDRLLGVLKSTVPHKHKIILISSIREGNEKLDKELFKEVLNAFKYWGYKNLDESISIQELGNNPLYNKYRINYNNEIKDFITSLIDYCIEHKSKNCNKTCKKYFDRANPILTTKYSKYLLCRLERRIGI